MNKNQLNEDAVEFAPSGPSAELSANSIMYWMPWGKIHHISFPSDNMGNRDSDKTSVFEKNRSHISVIASGGGAFVGLGDSSGRETGFFQRLYVPPEVWMDIRLPDKYNPPNNKNENQWTLVVSRSGNTNFVQVCERGY